MTRGRLRFARVVAALLAVFWGLLWFGLIDLLVVVEQDTQFHEHYLLESGWGLLFLVLVAVPLGVLSVRPGRSEPVAQLTACAAAVVVAGVWAADRPTLLNGLGLLVSALLVGSLGGARPPRWASPAPLPAALAVVALVAAIGYGHPLARNTTLAEDITNGVSHFPVQAALGLAVAALAGLVAVTGSRLVTWTTGFAVLWLGVESLAYPGLVGSLGRVGVAAAVVWAGLLVLATVRVRGRESAVRGH